MRLSSYLIIVLATAVSLHIFSLIPRGDTSTELDEYVKIFKYEMEIRGLKLDYSDVKIRFSNRLPLPNSVGISLPMASSRYVFILKQYYERVPPEIQEALIIHELGHTFGLYHNDNMVFLFPLQKKCPLTVMHSSDDLQSCFYTYRNYYYNVLANDIKRLDKKSM